MSIIVWEVDKWCKEPRRKEYARETASFYVHADGRRDAKRTSYSKMYSNFEDACRAIKSRLEAEQEKIRAELVRKAVFELLEAAEFGHADSMGMPAGDLLAAANILRNTGYCELAVQLEKKHEMEMAAIAKARGKS